MLATISIPVAELANLKPVHCSVLAGLLAFTDRAGRCWPSLRKLAEITGLKLSRVHRAIAEMEEARILTRMRRGAGTLYQLAERFVWQAVRRKAVEAATPTCSTSEKVSSGGGTEGEARKEIQELKIKRDAPVRRAAPPPTRHPTERPAAVAEGPNPFARRQWLRTLNSYVGERLKGPEQWAGWEVVTKAFNGDQLAPDEKRALDGLDRAMRQCGYRPG